MTLEYRGIPPRESQFHDWKSNGPAMRTGRGESIAQHGELFQGQIDDEGNGRRRCLVSLPCDKLSSRVTFSPNGDHSVTIVPSYKEKAKKAVELTLEYFGISGVGGIITVESNIPEAKGFGSSTADCIAAVLAAADCLGRLLSEEDMAKLVVQAEVASDNIMFKRAVLFAHREGVVLEDYAKSFPRLEVLGIDTAEDGHVDTLDFPPAVYSWRQRQSFQTLTSALRRSIRKDDIALLGRVATASACINEVFLPKPRFREIRLIAEQLGALGVAVAHSGTVMSILLDPNDSELESKVDQIRGLLGGIGISKVLRFQT